MTRQPVTSKCQSGSEISSRDRYPEASRGLLDAGLLTFPNVLATISDERDLRVSRMQGAASNGSVSSDSAA